MRHLATARTTGSLLPGARGFLAETVSRFRKTPFLPAVVTNWKRTNYPQVCGLSGQEEALYMKKQTTVIRRDKHWYVMLHLEPEQIEHHLQQENEERQRKGRRLFEYFVPYQFLPKAVPDPYAKDVAEQRRDAADANDLRRTMHHFVFIKASANEITRLVGRPWNREGRLHMHFYRSRAGRRITMPDAMMESFITLCCENRQRFTFGPAIENIDDYDTVVIASGTFKDTEAKVLDVQHTAHGISITLGIPFFHGEKTLTLPGYKPSDLHLPRTVESLLSDHFIDHVEDELIAILNRRVKHPSVTGVEQSEGATLNHLFHYSHVNMSDRPSRCRFRALMLICAVLRVDADSRQALVGELTQLLEGVVEVATEEQAYMFAALYVATANADYRTAAKCYQRQHPEVSQAFQRLLSPIKRMNKNFFKTVTPKHIV